MISSIPHNGQDHRSPLITPADEVEQERSTGGRERQVAEFVEDDSIDLGQEAGQPPNLPPLLFGLQLIDEVDNAEEPDPLAESDGLTPNCAWPS